MSSREQILKKIKGSLRKTQTVHTSDEQRNQAVLARINQHPRGIIPARTSLSRQDLLYHFCEKVKASEASCKIVESYEKAGIEIQKFLRQHNLPQLVRIGTDQRLNKLGWENEPPQLLIGPSDGQDLVCVSHAQYGVSETGTLVMTSGPENPTTLNFLPETHIILLNKKNLQESYEDSWAALRQRYGKEKLPRTVNMITGPSRSADIEQTLILGAHGPLRLHVIVIDGK
ncbi:MAG: lactate utilization protein C [Hyphomicrobiales bacterium]|nr:lactate utilization protein C [Hyphomicrobiales bacterium]